MRMLKAREVPRQIKAAWKFVASLLKCEWAIDDYPIWVRFQQASESDRSSRTKTYVWVASVINWPVMLGGGRTKLEALADIRKNFEHRKAKKQRLPRPGKGLPIEFASRSRVERHAELATDFTKRVLQLEWAWISDDSSLWDFHGDDTNDSLNARVREIYGVDVSDVPSGNLADIFDKIAENRVGEN